MSISEQLKQAINDCGQTVYVVARDSGVSHATIYRFLSGERSLSLDNADRLAEYLELELRPVKKRK